MTRIGQIVLSTLFFITPVCAQLPEAVMLPYARPNQPYSVQLSTNISGRAPFSFLLRPNFGEIPQGLALQSTTGVLSGIPKSPTLEKSNYHETAWRLAKTTTQNYAPNAVQPARTYHFIVDVRDVTGTVLQSLPLALSVSQAPQPVEISFDAGHNATAAQAIKSKKKDPANGKEVKSQQDQSSVAPTSSSDVTAKLGQSSGGADTNTEKPASTLAKPSLPPVLVVGSTQLTVTADPPSSSGTDKLQMLSLGSATSTCDPSSATPLAMVDANKQSTLEITANSNGVTPISLADPMPKGAFLCAYRTFTPSTGAATNSSSDIAQVVLVQPQFLNDPESGATTIQVLATPTDTKNTGTTNVGLLLLTPVGPKKENPGDTPKKTDIEPKPCAFSEGIPYLLSGNKLTTQTDSQGIATLTLASGLPEGTKVCAYQSFTSKAGSDVDIADGAATSFPKAVVDSLDWGRVRAYFAGGVLIANDQNSFSSSSSSPFLLFNLEKTWILPGCATLNPINPQDPQKQTGCRKQGAAPYHPGVTTYFETRMTAIPVQTGTSNSASSATSATASGGDLSSQKTARLDVGIYAPWVLTHWYYDKKPNGLFLGPLAKVGFDTLTGSTSQTLVSGSSPVNFNRFYNHWGYGMRLGHYGLTNADNKSPEILSYLDVTLGPYTNLQSYLCATGSSCSTTDIKSRTTLYRLDLEGLLKIPKTVMFVGFNANVKAFSRKNLDLNLQPNDDLRILFGVKLDVASIIKKLGVSTN